MYKRSVWSSCDTITVKVIYILLNHFTNRNEFYRDILFEQVTLIKSSAVLVGEDKMTLKYKLEDESTRWQGNVDFVVKFHANFATIEKVK